MTTCLATDVILCQWQLLGWKYYGIESYLGQRVCSRKWYLPTTVNLLFETTKVFFCHQSTVHFLHQLILLSFALISHRVGLVLIHHLTCYITVLIDSFIKTIFIFFATGGIPVNTSHPQWLCTERIHCYERAHHSPWTLHKGVKTQKFTQSCTLNQNKQIVQI